MSPGARLRSAIAESGTVQAMAAHNPLSARLAEEAGFEAVWASGFELSAAYGLPDASLISMTQHLECTAAMAAGVDTPVIADLDTGFGNAANLAYAVNRYEAAGAAAAVIEDKLFPKMTSLAGGRQDLVRIAEFQGKIEAATSVRADPDFLIVARTEALVAGLGLPEALKRAHAYEEAGADLILVHSRSATPDEIVAFSMAWSGRAKLVIVPTAYPEFTLRAARDLGNIAMVIYGNHAIRATVAALRSAFAAIRANGSGAPVCGSIASVEDIFDLQRMGAHKALEDRFLR